MKGWLCPRCPIRRPDFRVHGSYRVFRTGGFSRTAEVGHHADAGEGVVDDEGLVVLQGHVGLGEDNHGAPPRVQVGVLFVPRELCRERCLHIDHRGSLGQNNLYMV